MRKLKEPIEALAVVPGKHGLVENVLVVSKGLFRSLVIVSEQNDCYPGTVEYNSWCLKVRNKYLFYDLDKED